MERGALDEIALVGKEGVVGISLFIGGEITPSRAVVQSGGLSPDRLPSIEQTMTQELIANMLGVRRERVTDATGKLNKAGVIAYRRVHITVLDRVELAARVYECHAVVKKECDRLLHIPPVR